MNSLHSGYWDWRKANVGQPRCLAEHCPTGSSGPGWSVIQAYTGCGQVGCRTTLLCKRKTCNTNHTNELETISKLYKKYDDSMS